MHIAQIAPLFESVPPRLYGGTERIVSYLTEELVALGHDVTLFASGDSVTRADHVRCCEMALRLAPGVEDTLPYHVMMLEEVRRRAASFDILHFHIGLLHYPVFRDIGDRTLTTLHGRLDMADLIPFYRMFPELPLVSISDDQRRPMPPVNWAATVHHGLPAGLLPFTAEARGGYLAFLGRISPEKRPDLAIEIATKAGIPLKIAAKVDNADREYWRDRIEPLLRGRPNVEYVGEIDEAAKPAFLGDALALLFPIDWPEPFGLVMIEAMSCGTPTIAFRRGSVPEIVEDGVTGRIVGGVDDAVRAVAEVAGYDRAGVRRRFEERFTAERMARGYVETYERLIGMDRLSRLRRLAQSEPGFSAVA